METGSTQARGPRALAVWAATLVGVAVGLGTFTLGYANVPSYLTDDASACANCHVMQGHLDAWAKSSHKTVATCNDCHASHAGVLAKYGSKAVNGFNHALAFTTGRYAEHLQLTDFNRRITEGACRGCHTALTGLVDVAHTDRQDVECTRCHSTVGHDR
ncbi:MAG: NapC/NirT family cytochrome c [bacterium]|nr:NapC/NirT family cytochrome c [bacterium]